MSQAEESDKIWNMHVSCKVGNTSLISLSEEEGFQSYRGYTHTPNKDDTVHINIVRDREGHLPIISLTRSFTEDPNDITGGPKEFSHYAGFGSDDLYIYQDDQGDDHTVWMNGIFSNVTIVIKKTKYGWQGLFTEANTLDDGTLTMGLYNCSEPWFGNLE